MDSKNLLACTIRQVHLPPEGYGQNHNSRPTWAFSRGYGRKYIYNIIVVYIYIASTNVDGVCLPPRTCFNLFLNFGCVLCVGRYRCSCSTFHNTLSCPSQNRRYHLLWALLSTAALQDLERLRQPFVVEALKRSHRIQWKVL
jgi:hypothetical protein